jgi:hypothetical protein
MPDRYLFSPQKVESNAYGTAFGEERRSENVIFLNNDVRLMRALIFKGTVLRKSTRENAL